MLTIDQMVNQEVLCCMSNMVPTLAGGFCRFGDLEPNLESLMEQASELAAPVPDYEEAAVQAGWRGPFTQEGAPSYFTGPNDVTVFETSWENICADEDIEPYDREVFEHWAVSEWLADKLIAKGEKVDKDFAGLCVWARTTSGQIIAADSVIERIYADMMKAD